MKAPARWLGWAALCPTSSLFQAAGASHSNDSRGYSVWIDHLHSENSQLVNLLDSREVLMHPMVIGELACGNLPNRTATLTRLKRLSLSPITSDDIVLSLIERHRPMGRGIGYIDAHLLTSVSIAGADLLWSRDRRLMNAVRGWVWLGRHESRTDTNPAQAYACSKGIYDDVKISDT